MLNYHPLAPVSKDNALDQVPLKRPRFSNNEALILNILINANGQVVTARKLAMQTGIMTQSVSTYICAIRAKIGEPAYQPTMIITDWPSEKNGYMLGWRFVG